MSSKTMTLANQLTMLRFAMALAMFAALMQQSHSAHVTAFFLFLGAMITDWVDGYIARLTHSISPFGKVADPIADKILVLGALIGLSRAHLGVPLWAVFLIIARELLMGGIRILTITEQGRIMAAQKWGKVSMAVQSVAVLTMLGLLVAREKTPLAPALTSLPYFLAALCAATAWASAYVYIRESRQLLEKSWG